MTSPELERLITRYLDREATVRERRELHARMQSDPAVAALVAEAADLDREIGRAMRAALGRPAEATSKPRSLWRRIGQLGTLAAAAALILAVWTSPLRMAATTDRPLTQQAGVAPAGSWFAPVTPRDVVREVNPSYERPQLRLRSTERNWLIIPADRPGEYLLIEMDQIQTQSVLLESDF